MPTIRRTALAPPFVSNRHGAAPTAAPAAPVDSEQIDKDKKRLKLEEDKRRLDSGDRPAQGRTTALGRKTESPASIKTAGPSGQKGKAQHQKLHANK